MPCCAAQTVYLPNRDCNTEICCFLVFKPTVRPGSGRAAPCGALRRASRLPPAFPRPRSQPGGPAAPMQIVQYQTANTGLPDAHSSLSAAEVRGRSRPLAVGVRRAAAVPLRVMVGDVAPPPASHAGRHGPARREEALCRHLRPLRRRAWVVWLPACRRCRWYGGLGAALGCVLSLVCARESFSAEAPIV